MDDRYRAVDAWVRRLLPATPPAILLGIGSPNDLSMLRSFRRRGIPALHLVLGRLVGSFSRFGFRVRMPPVEREPEEWLRVLDRIASALESPAVLLGAPLHHSWPRSAAPSFLALTTARRFPGCRHVPQSGRLSTCISEWTVTLKWGLSYYAQPWLVDRRVGVVHRDRSEPRTSPSSR